MRLFRNESGSALPLALLVMVTTSAILVTAITTTELERSHGQPRQDGRQRAGAGRGRARQRVSILGKPGRTQHPCAVPGHRGRRAQITMENGTPSLGVYNTDDQRLDAVREGVHPEPDGRRAGHQDPLANGPGARHRGRFDRAGVEPLHPRRREHLLHDRHRRRFPGPSLRGVRCASARRQRRREHDRRADHGRRGTTLTTEGPDVASPLRAPHRRRPRGWTNPTPAFLGTTDASRTTDSIPLEHPSAQSDGERVLLLRETIFRPPRSFAGFRSRSSGRAATPHGGSETTTCFLLKAGARRRHRPARRAGLGDDRRHGDLWQLDRPLGHDLDARPDQRHRTSASGCRVGNDTARARACLDQPHPRDRHLLLRSDGGDRARGEPDLTGRHRRHVQDQQRRRAEPATRRQASTRRRSRTRRPRSSSRRSISTGGGATRSRARCTPAPSPGTPSRTVSTPTPGRPRERLCARQQRQYIGRDHADERELHVPGEGERRARGRDLLEQRDPCAQGLRHDLLRRRHPLRRQRPDRPLPGPSDHLRERRHRVRRAGLRRRQRPDQLRGHPGDMSAWTPSTDLLMILAGDLSTSQPCCPTAGRTPSSTTRRRARTRPGRRPRAPGAFQGIVYAKGNCQIHEFFKISGPVICNRITIDDGRAGGFPTFSAFPPLGSLVDGSIYLNPDNPDRRSR